MNRTGFAQYSLYIVKKDGQTIHRRTDSL